MTATLDEVYVGDANIPVVLTVKKNDGTVYDISAATGRQMSIKKPGLAATDVTATFVSDGKDGKITYTVPAIDTPGTWMVRAKLTFTTRIQKSSAYKFIAHTP